MNTLKLCRLDNASERRSACYLSIKEKRVKWSIKPSFNGHSAFWNCILLFQGELLLFRQFLIRGGRWGFVFSEDGLIMEVLSSCRDWTCNLLLCEWEGTLQGGVKKSSLPNSLRTTFAVIPITHSHNYTEHIGSLLHNLPARLAATLLI